MAAEPTVRWPTIASSMGPCGDARADLLIVTLQGSGIPAVRRPSIPTSRPPAAAWPMVRPAQVLAPPDREDDAPELAAEQPYRAVHPLMRRVGHWIIAVVRLVAALTPEGVLHLDVRPLVVALGFYSLPALLTPAIWWLQGRLATPAPW